METLKTGHRQYNAIDIMKVIMALLVVMIHKPFFSPEHPFAKYISEEVIASIAGVAAAEVEGVSSIVGGRDLTDKLGNHKVSPGKGIHLAITDEAVVVELSITVDSTAPVRKVAEQVQEAVISCVRDMTGLTVSLPLRLNWPTARLSQARPARCWALPQAP